MRLKANTIDGNGSEGIYSKFEVEHVGENKIRLKGIGKGEYLRMSPRHVDYGPGGVNCEFYVVRHKERMNGERVVSLEGVAHPGCYVGFRSDGGAKRVSDSSGLGRLGSFSVTVL